MGKVKTQSTTTAIGYECQEDALESIYKEENLSMLRSKYGRLEDLLKTRKVVGTIKTGMQIRAQLYRYSYTGTVLGYKRTAKGWVMGLLLRSGRVKDVSIDPFKWFSGDETTFVVVDKTVYAIFKHGYRLALSPVNQ